jgi:predicted GIY-YIG superfamily endonuclease
MFASAASTAVTVAGDITLHLYGQSPAPDLAPGTYTYVLDCADDCIYIGMSGNLLTRLADQWIGRGARWVKRHPMLSVREVYRHPTRGEATAHESVLTRAYKQLIGADRVKGAGS